MAQHIPLSSLLTPHNLATRSSSIRLWSLSGTFPALYVTSPASSPKDFSHAVSSRRRGHSGIFGRGQIGHRACLFFFRLRFDLNAHSRPRGSQRPQNLVGTAQKAVAWASLTPRSSRASTVRIRPSRTSSNSHGRFPIPTSFFRRHKDPRCCFMRTRLTFPFWYRVDAATGTTQCLPWRPSNLDSVVTVHGFYSRHDVPCLG